MKKINNYQFDLSEISNDDVFICTLGYEDRSVYLLDKLIDKIRNDRIFVLCFEDLKETPSISCYLNRLEQMDIRTETVSYEHGYSVADKVSDYLKFTSPINGKVYVDYSSMPRTWYSMLPEKISESGVSDIVFLYDVGEYPVDYKAYPSAGIESYSIIGRSSLRDKKRLHIIGIGYDAVRTKALISILDPDMYSVCSAHYSKDSEMEKRVREVNQHVLEQAVSFVGLCTDDFSYMVARLCELANEYLPLGDVVFVPDGPKPLIMAMSLVPQIIKKEGVVCLHVARNSTCYKFMNVKPTDNIISFEIQNDDVEDMRG